jgi:tetratricopeptide (TPR) repeat protein
MAWCYVDMGKTYAALHALTTALEIEPHRGDWAYEVGKLYHEVGKPHLARRWYERALQMGEDRARKSLDVLPSETAEQWYDTGQEYEAAGEFAIAQRCYERALRMGESRAREALDRLRSIANEE